MGERVFRYQITMEGKLGNPYAGEEAMPITADFCENEEGGMTLLRWPRLAGAADSDCRYGICAGAFGGKAVWADVWIGGQL